MRSCFLLRYSISLSKIMFRCSSTFPLWNISHSHCCFARNSLSWFCWRTSSDSFWRRYSSFRTCFGNLSTWKRWPRIQGYKDTRIQGYKHGRLNIWVNIRPAMIQEYKNTRIQEYIKQCTKKRYGFLHNSLKRKENMKDCLIRLTLPEYVDNTL